MTSDLSLVIIVGAAVMAIIWIIFPFAVLHELCKISRWAASINWQLERLRAETAEKRQNETQGIGHQ